LVKHLKVLESEAQMTKVLLEKVGALNTDFIPLREDGFILWPLNFEVDGNILDMPGTPSTKISRDYRKKLPSEIKAIAPRAFDIFGNIAIIKLSEELEPFFSNISDSLISSNPNIDKVALDLGVKGDFRVRKLKMISDNSNFVASHKENGLTFTLDISKVYFSPRLAMERYRLSNLVSKGEAVLDAFAGAAPFSVTLAKKGAFVTSIDANPDSESWANKNFINNGILSENFVFHCSRVEEYNFRNKTFDRVIMNNPTDPLSYLSTLSKLVNPGGLIHMYMIDSKDADFDISECLDKDFKCDRIRKVHPYSPSSVMKVFDITRINF